VCKINQLAYIWINYGLADFKTEERNHANSMIAWTPVSRLGFKSVDRVSSKIKISANLKVCF